MTLAEKSTIRQHLIAVQLAEVLGNVSETRRGWGPVPERHLCAEMRATGLFLHRRIRSRFPMQGVES